jgi:hypothetical protein
VPVSEVCAIIRKLSFSHCVGMTAQSDDDWTLFFTSHRERFLDIDNALMKIAQIFAKECSMQSSTNTDFIYKYFNNFLPMIKKLANIRNSYSQQINDGFNRLIFRDRITPNEALSCTHQFARLHLSTKDSIRQLRMVYNIKLDFLREFAEFLQLKSYDYFFVTKSHNDSKVRVKRHFLTHPLSILTGLADADTVQKLSEQSRNVITAVQMDSEQIAILENRTNSILDSLQTQSVKLGRLYKDENK